MFNGLFSLYFIFISLFVILIYYAVIPYLKRLKFGQSVRLDGPRTHLNKNGTPTMGGLIIFIVFTFVLISLLLILKDHLNISELYKLIIMTLVPISGYALIGFIDDYLIVVKKNNKGLLPHQKLLLELLISIIIFVLYRYFNCSLMVNLFGLDINFGYFYGPFIILLFISTTNSTNLTDGIDGLLTSTTIPIIIGFIVIGMIKDNYVVVISSISMLVALISFLFFNFPKASLFMGDTGSLMIGAYVAITVIILKIEILLLIFGLIYIIETLSVIIQVVYFKKTKGKRIFKMAPIHHHLELSGYSDLKINIIYFLLSVILSALGVCFVYLWY